MVYAKIVGDLITHYPSSIGYLVAQGVLDTENPTDGQLAVANVVVVNQACPAKPIDEFNYELKPVQHQNGLWWEEWVKIATPGAVLQRNKDCHAHMVIEERNKLLAQSDWTQMADVPVTNKDAWRTYRQALRDVPTQTGFPFAVQWPQAPR